MAIHIHKNTNPRFVSRIQRKARIRSKLVRQKGLMPRLVVYRSNRFLYAQVVDDLNGDTLVQANTGEKEFEKLKSKKNVEVAGTLGKMIGARALEKKIERVVFDRNGYCYHGKIKHIADGAREAGLKF